MINKKGITNYDPKTGEELTSSWEELDRTYQTIGPKLFNALISFGAEVYKQNEFAIEAKKRYSQMAKETQNKASIDLPQDNLEAILKISHEMDLAMKNEDWNTLRLLKEQKARLEQK